MTHGGAREGAGRKPGGKNKRTIAAEELRGKLFDAGKSPLEIIIGNMHKAEARAEKLAAQLETMALPANASEEAIRALADLYKEARAFMAMANECAKDAAPYMHPRMAPIDSPIEIELPEVKTAADIAAAQQSILGAVAVGEITPDEGAKVSGIIEARRRAIETSDLEQRIAALEAQKGNGR